MVVRIKDNEVPEILQYQYSSNTTISNSKFEHSLRVVLISTFLRIKVSFKM